MSSIIIPRPFKLRLEYNAASGKKGKTYLPDEHAPYINYLIHDMTQQQKEDPNFDCVGYWQGMIIGIQNERCGDVLYRFVVKVPEAYPEVPPIVRFVTKIALPCVDNRGFVNVSKIPNFAWNPHYNIADVLVALRNAMKDKVWIAQSSALRDQVFFNEAPQSSPEKNFQ
eukprot:UN01426